MHYSFRAPENPGQPSVRKAFEPAGGEIVGVPVEAGGLVVQRIPANAAVICVTPAQLFSVGKRHVGAAPPLLVPAQARGAVVVEDDYDS